MKDESVPSRDGFAASRARAGVAIHYDGDERIPLILRHSAVRTAAKDWQTFSSNAPFRVPIPSEEGVRSFRQIPIEFDPPSHTHYRKLIEPWFLRPLKADYIQQLDKLVANALEDLRTESEHEVVAGFALQLQSRALALLLGVPQSDAEIWVNWGRSLYRDGDGGAKNQQLDAYISERFSEARAKPEAENLFSFLSHREIGGRKLSAEECSGIANLVFAGGRDTVINTIAEIIAHFCSHPADAKAIADEPRLAISATEEFVRATSPLTIIARKCPAGAHLGTETVEPGKRIGLCWAAANHDPNVFDKPEMIRIDRKPNPHLGFGSGVHNCLGSAHARGLLRSLIRQFCTLPERPRIIEATPAVERFGEASRRVGYDRLMVRFGV